jgi:hypothetical protein
MAYITHSVGVCLRYRAPASYHPNTVTTLVCEEFMPQRNCVCGTRLARDNGARLCGACQKRSLSALIAAPKVPRHFWDDPEIVAALADRHIGRVLEAYRLHGFHPKPISQATVASWCDLSQSQLSRIVHGPAVSDLAKLMRWAHALRIPPDLLWFTMPRSVDDAASEEDEVQRRQLLRSAIAGSGVTLSGSVLDQLDQLRRSLDRALAGDPVSEATLDRWEAMPSRYAQSYQSVAPSELLAGVAADFIELQRQMSARQASHHRVTLCRVSGRLAVLAGIFLAAQGDQRNAQAWFRTAGLASKVSDDRQLAGMALVRSGIVSLYHEAPTQALHSISKAKVLLGDAPTPWRARALVVEARSLAKIGKAGEARSLLHAAETAFEAMPSSALRDPALGFTERQFYFTSSNAYTHLGMTAEAEQMQRRAQALYQPNEHLDPALIELDRARCMLHERDPGRPSRAGDPQWP